MYNQTILIGVLVSMLFTEVTNLSAGLVIPGYLVLNLHNPVRILYTFVIASAAVLICRLLANVLILYGRRRFALLMVLTFLLAAALQASGIVRFSVIGTILPGLIARELDRQGFRDTLLAIAAVTGITRVLLLLLW